MGKDLQIKLLIELWQIALSLGGQEFGGKCRQNAVITGRVITQRLLQRRRHQTGIARAGQQMSETGLQLPLRQNSCRPDMI